ncbi:MAG: 50S ribosomal protein L34 [Opitutales bacterium]
MAPTYRPHKVKRVRKCGYRSRCKTRGGRDVIKRRRARGRKRLALVKTHK